MTKKNQYLEKQRAIYRGMLDAGMDVGFQMCWDLVQLALRDSDVVGKDVFGKERIKRLYKGIKAKESIFGGALTDGVDADYLQEKLDANLREIWGDETYEFAERYPYIKQLDYKKGKKEWKK